MEPGFERDPRKPRSLQHGGDLIFRKPPQDTVEELARTVNHLAFEPQPCSTGGLCCQPALYFFDDAADDIADFRFVVLRTETHQGTLDCGTNADFVRARCLWR